MSTSWASEVGPDLTRRLRAARDLMSTPDSPDSEIKMSAGMAMTR